MFRYLTIIVCKSGVSLIRPYPAMRPGFRPSAYVVLTREAGFGGEKFRG
jgi:hypothetical protein